FVASDPSALAGQEMEIFFLTNGEVAYLQRGKKPLFFNKKGISIQKNGNFQNLPESAIAKGKFEHFMLKEIFEQPRVIKDSLVDRYDEKNQTVCFPEITFDQKIFQEVSNILIIACGTSWHAAYIGAYVLEQYTNIPTRAEIASEFRYKHTVIAPKTLVIVMSQSGETADTIAGLREAKRQKAVTLAFCNVKGSTIDREADSTLLLRAGPEVAVASTKTFTAQVMLLLLLTLKLARERSVMNEEQGRLFFHKLYELPEQVAEVLENRDAIQALAKKYAKKEDFFFLGRGLLYPTALEAALKIKEIAYINATGYPAGEMKHGPIAFLDEEVPVVIFLASGSLHQKIMSNLMESKARKSPVIAISWKQFEKDIEKHVDDIIWIPKTDDMLSCIPVTVVTQLFAYFMAKERNRNIDQPRNLAKSVTVE
ncbi:MAG: glutamine--fructose-6-phosphate transaminase (isomerizing), partial [Chlamydiota bacterium]